MAERDHRCTAGSAWSWRLVAGHKGQGRPGVGKRHKWATAGLTAVCAGLWAAALPAPITRLGRDLGWLAITASVILAVWVIMPPGRIGRAETELARIRRRLDDQDEAWTAWRETTADLRLIKGGRDGA
jgi:hypothetical protein